MFTPGAYQPLQFVASASTPIESPIFSARSQFHVHPITVSDVYAVHAEVEKLWLDVEPRYSAVKKAAFAEIFFDYITLTEDFQDIFSFNFAKIDVFRKVPTFIFAKAVV